MKYLSKAILVACFASSTLYAADIKQSALPTKTTPVTGDKALIIDSADGNKSKNVTLGSLPISTATQTALNLKADASSFTSRSAFTTAWGWNPGDNLGSATAANVSSLFTGSGDCLKSDGTKGDCGTGSFLPAWFPTTGPTDGRQILQAIGGCSNATYSTQVTCEAASSTWTTPSYTHTSIISGLINDTGTNDDDLWSAAKTVSELSKKQDDLVVPSQAEAEAGTSTTERVWTAQRVAQAIAALAPSSTGGNVILQQSFVSASTLVADTGAKNKLASGVHWTTADVGCDASDTLTVSVKSSVTINGTYTEIGTIALSSTASLSDVDISSWVDSIQGHWIRIDLLGTPASAKDCIIAIGGVEL